MVGFAQSAADRQNSKSGKNERASSNKAKETRTNKRSDKDISLYKITETTNLPRLRPRTPPTRAKP